ncbi:hypothetical protein [Natronosalvus caseinilyticus]|uniref:hypothetical protein n=1 Tax=Natronosalvus caseinilyticus TaxID=2953747 RepID=UPI0028AAD872|nr:hypothetical protein [Natronosalvus caseinilyticus]
MNPSLDSETIQEELRELAGHGVVERMDVDGMMRYRLTDDGHDELEGTRLFEAESTLKHYYEQTE